MKSSIASPTRANDQLHLRWAMYASIMLTALFIWVYHYEPFTQISEYVNDKVLDILTLIPSLAAAYWGTKLARHFNQAEPPYRIWNTFAIGWWFWVGGELLGFVYDAIYRNSSYPELTLIDLFWALGYFFFGISLYYQFKLINFGKQRRLSLLYFLFIAIALALAYALTQWAFNAGLGADTAWLVVYISILYPVFDTFQGGAALRLFFLFGRGYLGRPWWGLIAFAIADSIYIFFWLGGDQWISPQAYTLLDLFSSTAYLSGYIISALAFLVAGDRLDSLSAPQAYHAPAQAGD